tara:strand:+ start:5181 stop:5657 length:477 start_codon:yes stop_codon:yes gene_type:complete
MPIATRSGIIDISKEEDTARLAKKFSNFLKKGDVVFLYGEIGVGKTTFIKYLINSFQKKKRVKITNITSPTFNLINEYLVKDITFQHFDLFRLKNNKEIFNIGLLENLKDSITLVEWPQLIKKEIKNKIEIYFEYEDNLERRFIRISGLNEAYKNVVK